MCLHSLLEGKDTKAVLTWMQKHSKIYFLSFDFGNGYFVLTYTLTKQMKCVHLLSSLEENLSPKGLSLAKFHITGNRVI